MNIVVLAEKDGHLIPLSLYKDGNGVWVKTTNGNVFAVDEEKLAEFLLTQTTECRSIYGSYKDL